MQDLADSLEAHGYRLPATGSGRDDPLACQVMRLSSLSKEVEEAALALEELTSSAAFADLVNADALRAKTALLEGIQTRIAAVLAGTEQVLSFVQSQHARGGGTSLPVHAAHQENVQDLFHSVLEQLEHMQSLAEARQWSATPKAADARAAFDLNVAEVAAWQARYRRALEASERLTALLEQE